VDVAAQAIAYVCRSPLSALGACVMTWPGAAAGRRCPGWRSPSGLNPVGLHSVADPSGAAYFPICAAPFLSLRSSRLVSTRPPRPPPLPPAAHSTTALLLYPAYILLRALPPPSTLPLPPPTTAAVARLHRSLWLAVPPLAAAAAAAALDVPAAAVVPAYYPLKAAGAVWLVAPPGGRASPAEAAVRTWGGEVSTAVEEWRRTGRLVWRGGDGQG